MSAVVCGKRSPIFGDDLVASPSSPPSPSHHHHPAKRARCSPSRRREVLLHHHLLPLFPDMDPQVLPVNGHLDIATENPPATDNSQTSHHSSEWVELFVKEMMSSSDIDDARARASRALEVFEKSIMDRVGAEAVQNLHRENVMLKEQLAIIVRENAVLKRGVAIQHERQKDFDVRTEEVDSLKQLVLQYQEQLKTLEINNYALRVHLKQAQQNNSMPGRFPPDVF